MDSVTTRILLKLWFGISEEGPKFTIDDIFDFFKKEERPQVESAIKNLKRRKSIKQKQNYNGSILISLSEKGKLRVLNSIFRRFEHRKEKWDGKWRMISFDIPNFCAKGRKALVYRLKIAGFYKLQESVFLYPHRCENEIRALAKLFKIENYIKLGLLDSVDGQNYLIKYFKLKQRKKNRKK